MSVTISISLDGCIDASNGYSKEPCSGHGTCGKFYHGLCACDEGWSGPLCDQIDCPPFAGDPTLPQSTGSELQFLPPDCYGNGQCVLNGTQPTCRCDDTHRWGEYSPSNPTTGIFELTIDASLNGNLPTGADVCALRATALADFKAEGGIIDGSINGRYNVDSRLNMTDCYSGAEIGKGLTLSDYYSALIASQKNISGATQCRTFRESNSLGINRWAVYRFEIPEGQQGLMLAELVQHISNPNEERPDPILLLRKGDMPTMDSIISQRIDLEGWAANTFSETSAESSAPNTPARKILTKNSEVLSPGRWYLGVYSSRYGTHFGTGNRKLKYTLDVTISNVQNSRDANCPDNMHTFQCGGQNNLCGISGSEPVCACYKIASPEQDSNGVKTRKRFGGDDCTTEYTSILLDASVPPSPPSGSSKPPLEAWHHSFIPVKSLSPGAWAFYEVEYTADALDASHAHGIRPTLVVELEPRNRIQGSLSPMPLLLVQTPDDPPGLPGLHRPALWDSAAVDRDNKRNHVTSWAKSPAEMWRPDANQTVVLRDIDTCQSGYTEAESLKCYRIAVHNRAHARGKLDFRLRLKLRSRAQVANEAASHGLPYSDACAVAEHLAMNGRVTAATVHPEVTLISETNAPLPSVACSGHGACFEVESTTRATGYFCKCDLGWRGSTCESPAAFATTELISALAKTTSLCSQCSQAVSLAEGRVALFRVPAPPFDNAGVRFRVQSQVQQVTAPTLFIATEPPRSFFDFTISHSELVIPAKNGQTSSDVPAFILTVDLNTTPASGVFFVAMLTAKSGTSSTINTNITALARRLASGSDSNVPIYTVTTSRFNLPTTISQSITDDNLHELLGNWLLTEPAGVVTLIIAVSIFTTLCFGCIWRMCCGIENKDHTQQSVSKTLTQLSEQISQRHLKSQRQLQAQIAKPASSIPIRKRNGPWDSEDLAEVSLESDDGIPMANPIQVTHGGVAMAQTEFPENPTPDSEVI